MRISVKWLVLAMAVCAAIGAAHAAEGPPAAADAQGPVRQTEGVVKVIVDFARPLILARPAGTVIIGNPAIAQATLSDDKTVILTGKTPGSTNLIVMDAEGAEVANVVVDVVAAGGRLVTVDEGTAIWYPAWPARRRLPPLRKSSKAALQALASHDRLGSLDHAIGMRRDRLRLTGLSASPGRKKVNG
jgi:hypothetical protein